jgi:peptidyl-prolyl cis-trans isomerase SurA
MKILISVVVVLIIAVGVYFIVTSNGDDNLEVEPATLEGNVALVNGVAISQETFDAQLATSIATFTSQGIDVEDPVNLLQIKNQVLDNLINNEVLNQAVLTSDIEITPEEVDAEIANLLSQAGSQEALDAQLATAGLTEEGLRSDIIRQLATQRYLAQNVDVNSVTVSDEEVQKFYDDSKVAQPDLPPLDEVRDQAVQQLTVNKQQALVNDFIVSLRAEAEIETAPLE